MYEKGARPRKKIRLKGRIIVQYMSDKARRYHFMEFIIVNFYQIFGQLNVKL